MSNLRFAGIAGCFSPTCIPEASNYSDIGATRVSGTIGYKYPLSKRTNIYTAASYTRDDLDKQVTVGSEETENVNPHAVQVVLGLVHRF